MDLSSSHPSLSPPDTRVWLSTELTFKALSLRLFDSGRPFFTGSLAGLTATARLHRHGAIEADASLGLVQVASIPNELWREQFEWLQVRLDWTEVLS